MSQPTASPTPSPSVKAQTSEIAMATAMMHALDAHDEGAEIRGPYTLAELCMTEDRLPPLKDSALHQRVMKNKVAQGAHEFMIARTGIFDEVAMSAFDAGLLQLVLLVVAYDSLRQGKPPGRGSRHGLL